MKRFLLLLALGGLLGHRANALPNAPDIIPAQGGAIRITPIFHGSLQIEYKGKVIHVDPFSAGDYEGAKKADRVLITHSHPDHFDVKAMENVSKGVSPLTVAPLSMDAQLRRTRFFNHSSASGDTGTLITPLNKRTLGFQFVIQRVPMYNLKRGPKPDQKFHPKGRGNGYILTLGGKRIYIAGDTEATPEMKKLKNIDIAFLPMNLPYTMTPQEAALGARAFKPKVVYPYHYRHPFDKTNDNPQQFAKALAGSGIEAKLRGWYAHPARKLIAKP